MDTFVYLNPDGRIVYVAVTVTPDGKTQLVGQPAPTGFGEPEKGKRS